MMLFKVSSFRFFHGTENCSIRLKNTVSKPSGLNVDIYLNCVFGELVFKPPPLFLVEMVLESYFVVVYGTYLIGLSEM